MLQNFLKIAWRNLKKNTTSSLINVGGLAAGMTIVLLIFLWVRDELSFNHCHKNYKKLAVVMSVETINGSTTAEAWASVPMAAALRLSYAAYFQNLALTSTTTQLLKTNDKKITQEGMWAEPAFPEMFSLKMLKGNIHALDNPSVMLLSQSAAQALFANEEPIDKTIQVNDSTVMKVAGVYEDIPDNSRFSGRAFLLAWANKNNMGTGLSDDWLDHHYQLFVQLNDKADFETISAKIKNITKPHIRGGWEELLLHPMDKWLLYDKFENGKMVAGRMHFVWLFGITGIFVLLLACINYMNLSTARSEKRSREVGIRKVLGSGQRQLAAQFLGESLLMAMIALLLSLVLAQVFIPFFNTLTGKDMSIPFADIFFWLPVVAFTIFTGLIAGSYPALYLSRFQPSVVLKGGFKTGRAGLSARRILVIVQFTISITLITGTLVVFRQIQFAKKRSIGYNREGLITVEMNTPGIKNQFEALSNDLIATGMVKNIATSSSPATAVQNSMIGYDWEGRDPSSAPVIGTLFINQDFGKTIGWQIKEGRDFSSNFSADSGAFILNEAAVKFTGLKEPVAGKYIRWHGRDNPIVGVVKDMVMESPYNPVQPVFFTLSPNRRIHVITMRINNAFPAREALAKIAPVFKKYNPESPFEYHFTDELYSYKFQREEQIGRLANVFAGFAIFISCLGLFGLSSFVAEQRTREIGIRKILGASVFGIWQLLSKEFVLLVLVSMLISTPIALYAMHAWLQNYAYRAELSWWIFAGTGLAAVLITLLTVSYQSIRAAVVNPVQSLRNE